jgi:hypothetical protein
MAEHSVSPGLPEPQGVGEDPLFYFTRLFVKFFQVVFGTFDKGSYKWDQDPQITDVFITMDRTIAREVNEGRPAIIVERGQASFLNLSIDQFKSFSFDSGKRSHTDLVQASITVNCVAREGLEAQRLAWIAMYATRTLKRHLMRAGLHRVGEDLQVGPEEEAIKIVPDSIQGSVLVRVFVPFFFQDTWSIAPVDNLLLKQLDLRLTSQMNYPTQDGQPVLKDPAIKGRVLQYDKVLSLTQRVSVKKETA